MRIAGTVMKAPREDIVRGSSIMNRGWPPNRDALRTECTCIPRLCWGNDFESIMSKTAPRVLHIIDSFNMGGAETWLLEIVRHASRHRPDMPKFDFVAAGGEKGILDDEVLAMGCRIYYLKLDRRHPLSFMMGFRRLLRENGYSAIHDHQDFLSGWHFLFGSGLLPSVRISHVHNPHYQLYNNYGVTFPRRLNLRVGRALLMRFSTHILGTSSKLLAEYGMVAGSYPRQKVGPLYCAFDLSRYRGVHSEMKRRLCDEMGWDAETTRVVLFAGRMDVSTEIGHPNNHKNSRFALEVMGSLRDPNVKMVMAGANEYVRDRFMSVVRDRGLEERVRLLGIRRDLHELMLAADVLLFPSRSEGMGMVAVEAQAAGCPVLASDEVPREIVVMQEMVSFKDLESPFPEWASELEVLMSLRRQSDATDDERWKTSPFNIDVCCTRLAACYLHGRLGG
jgi:glycosyltransferase EpsF